MDDPEHISLDGYTDKLLNECNDISKELNILYNSLDKETLKYIINNDLFNGSD